jgi:hypothetical protein
MEGQLSAVQALVALGLVVLGPGGAGFAVLFARLKSVDQTCKGLDAKLTEVTTKVGKNTGDIIRIDTIQQSHVGLIGRLEKAAERRAEPRP